MINTGIFRTYDIRGVYGRDFDDELAYLLGLAYVELRKTEADYRPGRALQIAVGADMRLSSPALKKNLIRGLTAAGANTVDLGLVATPSLYFGVSRYGYDGGLMISASHNPKDWNGFKLVRAHGVPVSGESGIEFIKEKVLSGQLTPAPAPGQILKNERTLADEISYALAAVDVSRLKPIKIVTDTANGMGINYIKALAEKIPATFIMINPALDGSFPAHEADPLKEENLVPLKEEMARQKADLGVATDGDSDRFFFVDDKGETIAPAILRGLLAQIFLRDRPGAKIGYDARPGKITVDMIEAGGGIPVLTRVGHSLIKEQMLKENIYFAGESSGHFFFNDPRGCLEYPPLMILKLLENFSAANMSISDYLAPYRKYFASGEINRKVNDKEAVFARILAQYADGKIARLDGVSVAYPDFWFNVRASNTEALIRLNLEAVKPEIMAEKRDEVLKLLK
jgi:phosphomannomutase